jgi:hypothetical protein
MASIAINSASVAAASVKATPARPSFFSRVLQAMVESRQRKAAIEARRVMALLGQPREELDYALLPFRGE